MNQNTMKRALITLLISLTSLGTYAQWERVGGDTAYFTPNPGFGNGQSSSSIQLLQFHPQTNEPYVFFRHLKTNVAAGPSLIKFNGTNWEFVSEIFDGPGAGNTSSADFYWGFYFREDSNLPVVFYQDSYFENGSTKYKYRVSQRVGTMWEEIAGVDSSVVDDVFFGGHRVKMVRNPSTNLPVIIGNGPTQIPNGSKTIVSHFDAGKWDHIGGQTFGGFGAYVSDMDYNTKTNVPYAVISTLDSAGNSTIAEVWYYQGSWTSLGNPGFVPKNFGEGFRIRVNQENGDIYVLSPEAYNNPNNAQTYTLSIKKWDGTSWETIGTPDELYPTSLLGYDLEIHPVSGVPYVCFVDGNSLNGGINIRKWKDQKWTSINDTNLMGTLGEKIDLVFQPQTNIPHVVSTNGQLLRCKEATNPSTSVDQPELSNVLVYPNPATERVLITGVTLKEVELLDLHGKQLLLSDKNEFGIDHLSDGVYILRITSANNHTTFRKIVVR